MRLSVIAGAVDAPRAIAYLTACKTAAQARQ